MNTSSIKQAIRCVGFAAGAATAGYAVYSAATWLRYGRTKDRAARRSDLLLDRFMPVYEVVERHRVAVGAPAEITLSAACDMDLLESRLVRAIFWGRELILGGKPEENALPRSLLASVKAMGWGVLADVPGREIVLGAITQPWAADVVFHASRPDEFVKFQKPGYVKIAWTLRADPTDSGGSDFRTETRAVAIGSVARAKFRLYWSFVSPGVKLIRRLSLGIVKKEAERRARSRTGDRL
jgi:hypothetical protein